MTVSQQLQATWRHLNDPATAGFDTPLTIDECLRRLFDLQDPYSLDDFQRRWGLAGRRMTVGIQEDADGYAFTVGLERDKRHRQGRVVLSGVMAPCQRALDRRMHTHIQVRVTVADQWNLLALALIGMPLLAYGLVYTHLGLSLLGGALLGLALLGTWDRLRQRDHLYGAVRALLSERILT